MTQSATTTETDHQVNATSSVQRIQEREDIEWIGECILQTPLPDRPGPFSYSIGDLTFRLDGTVIVGDRAFGYKDAIDYSFHGHRAWREAGSRFLYIVSPNGESYVFQYDYDWGLGDAAWFRLFPRTRSENRSAFQRVVDLGETVYLVLCIPFILFGLCIELWKRVIFGLSLSGSSLPSTKSLRN